MELKENLITNVVDVTVAKLSNKGEGIAFYQDLEIYIPQVLLGEKLKVEVGEPFVTGSKRCSGKVVQIIEPSKNRVSSYPCSYYGLCGGCQYMHVDYQEQLRVKQADIALALSSAMGNEVNAQDIEIEALDKQNCRSKSIRYFALDSNNELIQGFYATRSHDLVAIDNCCQEVDGFGPLASSLNDCLKALKAPHNALKALQLRQADDGIMALLIVSNSFDATSVRESFISWAKDHKLGSFYLGFNNQEGNSLYCDKVELLFGKELLIKSLLGFKYYFGPQTFMQVNYDMTQKLYAQAIDHCIKNHKTIASSTAPSAAQGAAQGLEPAKAPSSAQADAQCAAQGAVLSAWQQGDLNDELALDLCCGVGTMSLALAQHYKKVIGVEIVDSAIELAQKNASLNNIDNASFIAGDINKVLPSLLKGALRSKVRAVIADPARSGLGSDCARLIGKISGPCAISLIFCSLTALKRDLPVLLKAGFKVSKVKGFDMFANTNHIETLVCLTKD